ncbi:MAG TPA: hypothetical protein VGL53_02375 [Bryobacteraceae bacterium]|jgi:hypothetical protein
MRCSMVLLTIVVIGTTSCAAKKTANVLPDPAVANNVPAPIKEYVDLEPGWRLRIIAPITKSGSYSVKFDAVETAGHGVTLKTSDDLIGYETAYWAVTARPFGGGITIRLTSAELTKNGQPEPIAMPTRAAVHVPSYARFVRIFYLTRKSDADHNMAIAGVGRFDQLEAFSRALRESPNATCASSPRERIYCDWVPNGVAVRPEIPKKGATGEARWVDRF